MQLLSKDSRQTLFYNSCLFWGAEEGGETHSNTLHDRQKSSLETEPHNFLPVQKLSFIQNMNRVATNSGGYMWKM